MNNPFSQFKSRANVKKRLWTGFLGLLCAIILLTVGLMSTGSALADSGGFPTPTATEIILPTLAPTPTATLIILPTQDPNTMLAEPETAVQSASEPGGASAKALPVESASAPAETSGSTFAAMLRMFVIATLITGLVLGIGVFVIWVMRKVGVLP
jgi:hypothetical protein